MYTIRLKEILLEKKFGPIEIGADLQYCKNCLGIPDDEAEFNGNQSAIRYGGFEFYFKKGKLEWFQNKHVLDDDFQFDRRFHFKNSNFQVSTWFQDFEEDLKLSKIQKFLKDNDINFNKKPFWDSIKLTINRNVELMFLHNKLDSSSIRSKDGLQENYNLVNDEEMWKFAGFFVLS